jgi:hypothetical protein
MSGATSARKVSNKHMNPSRIHRNRIQSFSEGMQISSSHSRRCCIVMLALLGWLVLSAPEKVRSAAITLPFADAATAADDGPQDGVFDAFTPLNLGSVDDNGWTSFRTALEFDFRALPPGAIINSASLDASLNNFEGTRQIALNGYAGDGTVSLSDFARDELVGLRTVGPAPTGLNFDVTSFLSDLQNSGATFAGFNLREDPPNQFNFVVMSLSMGVYDAPQLSVDYTVIPEPTGLALFGLGGALLVLTRQRHRATGLGSCALFPWQSKLGGSSARWRLDRVSERASGLLLVAVLAGLLAGCATIVTRPADPHLLDCLRDGQSTKEAVVLKLGQPSAILESGRILTYRVGQEKDRGYYLRDASATNWFELKFSLVLVFDPSEVLERHSLVEVR